MAPSRPSLGQLPLASALQASEPLGSLLKRVAQSQRRLDALAPLLPPALAQAVRAGPLDDRGWTLLVAHAAAAAKLRQMLPQIQAHLQSQGWLDGPVRLKVRRAP